MCFVDLNLISRHVFLWKKIYSSSRTRIEIQNYF